MARAHHNGGEPSQRMLRVAELIRHAMAELLTRGDIHDPVLDARRDRAGCACGPISSSPPSIVMPLGGKDASAGDRRRSSGTRSSCAARSRNAST